MLLASKEVIGPIVTTVSHDFTDICADLFGVNVGVESVPWDGAYILLQLFHLSLDFLDPVPEILDQSFLMLPRLSHDTFQVSEVARIIGVLSRGRGKAKIGKQLLSCQSNIEIGRGANG